MSPRTRYNFFMESEHREALKAIKERDGIPESEQIRRAIADWVAKQGLVAKSDRKRAATRKRP
ncbi:MAG: hypothetical protein AB7P34_22465 [Vicinamibacterales bacterium]